MQRHEAAALLTAIYNNPTCVNIAARLESQIADYDTKVEACLNALVEAAALRPSTSGCAISVSCYRPISARTRANLKEFGLVSKRNVGSKCVVHTINYVMGAFAVAGGLAYDMMVQGQTIVRVTIRHLATDTCEMFELNADISDGSPVNAVSCCEQIKFRAERLAAAVVTRTRTVASANLQLATEAQITLC